jgi:purine/pyrimidine-nucleoside phosphorylase
MFNVNEYFEGKVKSIGFDNKDGKQTIGVMAPGEYVFGTSTIEIMTVVSGKLTIQQPDSAEWKSYKKGESFEVAKNVKFKVKVEESSSYLCQYKD